VHVMVRVGWGTNKCMLVLVSSSPVPVPLSCRLFLEMAMPLRLWRANSDATLARSTYAVHPLPFKCRWLQGRPGGVATHPQGSQQRPACLPPPLQPASPPSRHPVPQSRPPYPPLTPCTPPSQFDPAFYLAGLCLHTILRPLVYAPHCVHLAHLEVAGGKGILVGGPCICRAPHCTRPVAEVD
jgi:hypothetical protein